MKKERRSQLRSKIKYVRYPSDICSVFIFTLICPLQCLLLHVLNNSSVRTKRNVFLDGIRANPKLG
ncbi:hypothetical protein YERSI8AC_30043 [Enterobacterales bacterium 8AC]|nr:hypothetical protein YERSI8AC_30043 [Enterobacterales bacterium 8AC]